MLLYTLSLSIYSHLLSSNKSSLYLFSSNFIFTLVLLFFLPYNMPTSRRLFYFFFIIIFHFLCICILYIVYALKIVDFIQINKNTDVSISINGNHKKRISQNRNSRYKQQFFDWMFDENRHIHNL